ncbi:hypothetical protein ILP97_17140 [Amycolatopsis sp. H6(2020)]|nr:hypothetical protein [Amycolatopsis sp. H6(2020)]
MSAHPHQEAAPPAQPTCWCCGAERGDNELVHLGNHPEVGICTRCARWMQRRATELDDAYHPTVAARLRAGIHTARNAVIRRGWHQRGLLGTLLRRIDRYLP